MAGRGSRLSSVGQGMPKPLIPVGGVPMFIRAARSMPPSDKWVFLVRDEHISGFGMDKIIRGEFPNAIVVPVEGDTGGQACTCALGLEHIDPDEPLFIGSCDNASLFDRAAYARLWEDDSVDCAVWTFTQRQMLRDRPHAWGWCRLGPDGSSVSGISVKSPVSSDPYGDHAMVGSFGFRRCRDFKAALDAMVADDHRINGEFYVDAVPQFLARMGKRSVIFDVDLFVCWGSPQDLREYAQMEAAAAGGECPHELQGEFSRLQDEWSRYLAQG
jgi:hypothetical protein